MSVESSRRHTIQSVKRNTVKSFSRAFPPVNGEREKTAHNHETASYWRRYDDSTLVADLSLSDQIRLLSIDYLFRRSAEFHSNHHFFHPTTAYDYTEDFDSIYPNAVVAEIQLFDDPK
jgi:hypothetical protein